MVVHRWPVLACATLVGCASAADRFVLGPPPPGVTVTEEVVYYEFGAFSAEAAGTAMARFGPTVAGSRAPAATTQSVEWSYELAHEGDRCRVQSITIELELQTILPRWLNAADSGEEMLERWREFEEAVRVHEDGHKARILAGAGDLRQLLMAVAPGPCDRLTAEIERRGTASLRRFDELNREYDRDTRGGQTQGVIWPPNRVIRIP